MLAQHASGWVEAVDLEKNYLKANCTLPPLPTHIFQRDPTRGQKVIGVVNYALASAPRLFMTHVDSFTRFVLGTGWHFHKSGLFFLTIPSYGFTIAKNKY